MSNDDGIGFLSFEFEDFMSAIGRVVIDKYEFFVKGEFSNAIEDNFNKFDLIKDRDYERNFHIELNIRIMAERPGFEPGGRFPAHTLSRRAP